MSETLNTGQAVLSHIAARLQAGNVTADEIPGRYSHGTVMSFSEAYDDIFPFMHGCPWQHELVPPGVLAAALDPKPGHDPFFGFISIGSWRVTTSEHARVVPRPRLGVLGIMEVSLVEVVETLPHGVASWAVEAHVAQQNYQKRYPHLDPKRYPDAVEAVHARLQVELEAGRAALRRLPR